MQNHFNVLFICTGNSARSIIAEAILNFKGRPRFTAYSAGSHPSGKVRAEAIAQLQAAGIPTAGLRSKSWDEFIRPDSPKMDFVFTVCDHAAREVCPLFRIGSSMGGDARSSMIVQAHWGVPDPPAVRDSPQDVARAFEEAFDILERRIGLFISLPLGSLDSVALKKEIDRIGEQ